jgi:hypothetical protein
MKHCGRRQRRDSAANARGRPGATGLHIAYGPVMMHRQPATPRQLASTHPLPDLHTRPDIVELTRRVRAEYLEMPGLNVTLSQAQRLWGADRPACEHVFASLVSSGFLRMIARDRFIRA